MVAETGAGRAALLGGRTATDFPVPETILTVSLARTAGAAVGVDIAPETARVNPAALTIPIEMAAGLDIGMRIKVGTRGASGIPVGSTAVVTRVLALAGMRDGARAGVITTAVVRDKAEVATVPPWTTISETAKPSKIQFIHRYMGFFGLTAAKKDFKTKVLVLGVSLNSQMF